MRHGDQTGTAQATISPHQARELEIACVEKSSRRTDAPGCYVRVSRHDTGPRRAPGWRRLCKCHSTL